MINISDADAYIAQHVIDTEDWSEADEAKKGRLLNVASQTLATKFSKYAVPDSAVFQFAAYLAVLYNDTNKNNMYGVKQFTVKGLSFTFESGRSSGNLASLIPQVCYDLVSEENGVKLSGVRIGRSVR